MMSSKTIISYLMIIAMMVAAVVDAKDLRGASDLEDKSRPLYTLNVRGGHRELSGSMKSGSKSKGSGSMSGSKSKGGSMSSKSKGGSMSGSKSKGGSKSSKSKGGSKSSKSKGGSMSSKSKGGSMSSKSKGGSMSGSMSGSKSKGSGSMSGSKRSTPLQRLTDFSEAFVTEAVPEVRFSLSNRAEALALLEEEEEVVGGTKAEAPEVDQLSRLALLSF